MIATNEILNRRHAVIALGSGGARGLAHLGAMQVIRESELIIERIVGTSIGSLVGALSAINSDPHQVREQVTKYLTSEKFQKRMGSLFDASPPKVPGQDGGFTAWYSRLKSLLWSHHLIHRIIRRPGILSAALIVDTINELVPAMDILECRTPLTIVALDLLSGERVELERGPLREAILASTAIPGIFPPVPWEGKLLCDLGVIESLPTRTARKYCSDLLIGVDVAPDLVPLNRCSTALETLLRVDELSERYQREYAKSIADVVIRPKVGCFQWFDFANPEPMMDAGLIAARELLCPATFQKPNDLYRIRINSK